MAIYVFFDTEFTGLNKNAKLISIGLVSSDEKKFYAELVDDFSSANQWVRENVLNKLPLRDKQPGYINIEGNTIYLKGDKKLVAQKLREWFSQWEDTVTMVADVPHWDWVLFCDIFGDAFSIPKNIYYIPLDVATLLWHKGIDPDINREEFAGVVDSSQKHNALHDALVCKACFEKLSS